MKRAIESRVGHTRGIGDEVGEAIIKNLGRKAGNAGKKIVKDVADPKFTKKVYNKKGGLTKKYKDYVLREMGDY